MSQFRKLHGPALISHQCSAVGRVNPPISGPRPEGIKSSRVYLSLSPCILVPTRPRSAARATTQHGVGNLAPCQAQVEMVPQWCHHTSAAYSTEWRGTARTFMYRDCQGFSVSAQIDMLGASPQGRQGLYNCVQRQRRRVIVNGLQGPFCSGCPGIPP
ncbi:hypothetical protein BC826DRAFT_188357 [Russula brevipes]|nr:hypothetical protein BC826DRAFT_188357 [Russula brevipes]